MYGSEQGSAPADQHGSQDLAPARSTSTRPEQLTLDVLLAAAWRRRTIMALCIVACTVLAGVAAFVMTPKYRAQVVMIPVKPDDGRGLLGSALGQLGGLGSLAGVGMLAGGGTKDEYIEYLRSYAFAARFIEDENLLPILFAKRWDAARGRWSVTDSDDVPTVAKGVRLLDEHVRSIQEERRTGVVTLTVVWRDREIAARWANLMVERANRDLRNRAIAEAQASINYLNAELAKTSVVELQQSLYRLLEGQIKSIMLAKVREQYAFKVIDPGFVPDADDFVRPKRLAMILLGTVFGIFVGLAAVLWTLRRSRSQFGGPRGALT